MRSSLRRLHLSRTPHQGWLRGWRTFRCIGTGGPPLHRPRKQVQQASRPLSALTRNQSPFAALCSLVAAAAAGDQRLCDLSDLTDLSDMSLSSRRWCTCGQAWTHITWTCLRPAASVCSAASQGEGCAGGNVRLQPPGRCRPGSRGASQEAAPRADRHRAIGFHGRRCWHR